MNRLLWCLTAASVLVALSANGAEPPANEGARHFVEKVQPLLKTRCLSCHGAEKAEAKLGLHSRAAMLAGGESGPSLVPGKPDESLLMQAVKHTHASLQMPPKEKLGAKDVAALERWIRDGAPWSEAVATSIPVVAGERLGDALHDERNPIVRLFDGRRLDLWSLKPVVAPTVPTPRQADRAKGVLDRFVLARLEADGVTPPAEATASVLMRRLTFDLTGLPPTFEDRRRFERAIEDQGRDAAYAELVESLLNSPRFGEHFARLWLDVARYSDSNGFDWDEFRPQAWRFRDYVIRSLNADKPFDRFTREQLAGDEMLAGPPRDAAEQDTLTATGFLRLGPHDNAAGLFDEQDRSRHELLVDLTEATAGAFLGLTFSCCRCHDHKYDPLSQADHYRFRAFFAAVRFADDVPLDSATEQTAIREWNEKIEVELKALREEVKSVEDKPPADKDERLKRLKDQIGDRQKQKRKFTHALLMTDKSGPPPATQVLFQGDHKSPREAVVPGFPSVLDPNPAAITPPADSQTTGRRSALANWIVAPENPWTARVFVNRIWLQLMDRPLVATPNDFGLGGVPPEDADILDHLASEFVKEKWSVKKLVRTIVTSAAYRQASSPANSAKGNHFLLRSPRRLSAEQLRDAVLAVSGLLTEKKDGPPVWPDLPRDVLNANPAFLDDNAEKTKGWYPSPKAEQFARSIFLVQKRNTRVPLLESFDLPDNSTPCARRGVSTVPTQALMLLNGPLTVDAARALSERLRRDAGEDPQTQIERAFQQTLQRSPTEAELPLLLRFLRERSLGELARVLFNLNEFAYID